MTVDSNGRDGTEVLGYRTEGVLGRGGMGVVYRARDVRLRRTVALKVIAPELARDERFRERFVRESELAMSLEHPNVVPIHDAGQEDGRLYLVMRCVEGTDLRALLRAEGALDPERALAIVRQVADALDAAHARGLVHRDVKPSNVLLDENEHAYLADFGLTRRVSDGGPRHGDSGSLGTPAYLAPEQIEGREVGGPADVYALGCLLYECLTGEPPFAGDSRLAVAWAHLEDEPPSASARSPQLPKAIDDVVRQAMAKEPEDRHGTCAQLAAEAATALGLGGRGHRRRGAMLLAAALVLLTALVVAYLARDGADAAAPLAAGPNKVIRVDPKTNAVSAVIDVGEFPAGVAVAGNSVWVYNLADHTVSEIDARTNEVVHVASVATTPGSQNTGGGHALVADAGGAWVVGRVQGLLTRIQSGGRGTHAHRLSGDLKAVAAGRGAVWVVAHRERRDFLLRVDSRTGVVTRRIRMPDGLSESGSVAERRASSGGLDSVAVGGGFVWAAANAAGTLYRVDPDTGAVDVRDLGDSTLRPVFGFGHVWMCVDGVMKRIEPSTLREVRSGTGLDGEREYVPGFGSMWRHDGGSGTLMRFDPRTGDVADLTPLPGLNRHEAAVTSIAAGAGGVWLTVARYY